MKVEGSLMKYAASGVFWSLVQVWVNRIFALGLWAVLARLLDPTAFGIAATGTLLLQVTPTLAELGFGRSIMQRKALQDSDINLPFFFSLGICLLVTLVVSLNADWISSQLHAEDAALYISLVIATLLLNVPSLFQEAVYKRNMQFKFLAIRTFYANVIGGVLAVIAALLGAGVWSFLVQAYVTCIINTFLIWRRPLWTPGLSLHTQSFREMLRFGYPLSLQTLNAFVGTRLIDFIIIGKFGLAAYGIYAIGSRLYTVLMRMLQGALGDVSLSALSRISDDRDRLVSVYRKTMMMGGYGTSTIFVLLASISPETCHVLFGSRWDGVDDIATLLMLMGAVNCVQYLNGPFQASRGNSHLMLVTGLSKTGISILALLLVPSDSIIELTIIFVLAQVAATPISFFFVTRELKMGMWAAYRLLLPPALINAACFAMVWFARPEVALLGLPVILQGVLLALLFAVLFFVLLVLVDRKKALKGVRMLRTALRSI
ncbi:lipopolysaccharide biosynthesis protein [Pseudooceanicola sediminis]|uniref:Lipopolysaccharide biosynthesis protein n=1 Tax=Pseudooceanicola sediminis TaxID=2211117 RepID=A0A399IVR9_9RHOB|nr:oligosaccharide flippase family protein [Pseudooceanicola sediminis]KAA2311704.1 oligosaccharide flippase family protein [Puniceibacterium sp. HSS470]RII37131.1 lipopolysaccharide biosynthesis protein [Pseudooceanicola sediminis]|tara:strand:- start:28830 stop:30293 length:1464 start_codon:yes stop_codon:yes gene_type:complete